MVQLTVVRISPLKPSIERQTHYNRQIIWWLSACALTIFGMILLGGVTRLTGSGLSMVEWRPIMGVVPPLTANDWQILFVKYQQFPEYKIINNGMSLGEFKKIFMYEYLHRMLGRLIGIMFVLPFIFFYVTGRTPKGLSPKLFIILMLGAAQGVLGWYMVQSGLTDDPRVSQYRLTAHLSNAVIIYSLIIWVTLDLLNRPDPQPAHLLLPSCLILALIFTMIVSGGLMAGTRAGYAYPTFPLMGDSFIPNEIYSMQPIWLSIFEDIATIQFNHRILAYFTTFAIMLFVIGALRSDISDAFKTGVKCISALITLQITLGISTLLLHVPTPLAAAHQSGAVALLTASIYITHTLYRAKDSRASG